MLKLCDMFTNRGINTVVIVAINKGDETLTLTMIRKMRREKLCACINSRQVTRSEPNHAHMYDIN